MKTKPPQKEFAVWIPPAGPDELGYYNHYETITEAIGDQGEGSMVYETTYKEIGRFKIQTNVVKIPKTKRLQRERNESTKQKDRPDN